MANYRFKKFKVEEHNGKKPENLIRGATRIQEKIFSINAIASSHEPDYVRCFSVFYGTRRPPACVENEKISPKHKGIITEISKTNDLTRFAIRNLNATSTLC